MAKPKPKSRSNLRYQYNEMTWQDAKGAIVTHPRYRDKPNSLDGKVFLNGYLRFVRDGKNLNDYMQVHGKFTARQVQAQARKLRKIYEETTGATFPLLRKVTRTAKKEKSDDTSWIASAVKKSGVSSKTGTKKKSKARKASAKKR